MRILVVGARYDYGDARRGDSVDYYQLYLPLRDLYPETQLYDFVGRAQQLGRSGMNSELVRFVRSRRPDLLIASPYTNEFEPAAIAELRRASTVVGYFYDDIWRQRYAADWSRHFDYVTTSDPEGVARIARGGGDNAIFVPFAFNENVFRPADVPVQYDVSFVGMFHPYRQWILERLAGSGIRVAAFGHKWPAGRVTLDEMVKVFNSSRINLNLSNSSQWDLRFLLSKPVGLLWNVKLGKHREQVKMRHFEIAGCGGFQLSYPVDYLAEFFSIGSEMVVFTSVDDLATKIKYFLEHENERLQIADASRRRATSDHTATRRLEGLVREVLMRRSAVA